MPISRDKEHLIKWIKISRGKFRLIVTCFSSDCTATQTAKIAHVNRNTANRYHFFLRSLVVKEALEERKKSQITNGIEIDESYFGPRRVRGKSGREAGKKIVVLGLRKRGGKVYCEIIPNASRLEIMPIIRSTVKSGADIYTDGWRSYDALAIYGYNHKKVNHSKDEFVREKDIHINGVESFWSWAKRRLNKFNGVPKKLFPIYLLETEWRFNHRTDILRDIRRLVLRYKRSHSS